MEIFGENKKRSSYFLAWEPRPRFPNLRPTKQNLGEIIDKTKHTFPYIFSSMRSLCYRHLRSFCTPRKALWEKCINVRTFFSLNDFMKIEALESVELLPIDIHIWKALSDKDYGGHSECTADVIPSSSNQSLPYLSFQGIVNFDEEVEEKTKAKGGFCAIKGYLRQSIDLRDYEGLSMELRGVPSSSQFAFNMACQSLFEDDLYQLEMLVTNNQWITVHLPFDHFKLTARGVARESQRKNDSLQLESIGFLYRTANGKNNEVSLLEYFFLE